jgi:hypothetical protein
MTAVLAVAAAALEVHSMIDVNVIVEVASHFESYARRTACAKLVTAKYPRREYRCAGVASKGRWSA